MQHSHRVFKIGSMKCVNTHGDQAGHQKQAITHKYVYNILCPPANRVDSQNKTKSTTEHLALFFACLSYSWYGAKPTWLDADSHTTKMPDAGISSMSATMDQGKHHNSNK